MNQEDYLKDRLDNQIDWYDKKSQWNQKWFKRLQVFQLIAAAIIPFLTGYLRPDGFWIKFSIGAIGVLIAAVGAVLGLYKFQENWLEYRTTCESLRHEKYLYLTNTEPYNQPDSFSILVKRIESQISKENSNWAQHMSKETLKEKKGGKQ